MDTRDLIVRGNRVVLPDAAQPAPAAIQIGAGAITAISKFDEIPPGAPVFEARDSVVMPGLVDTHVHINEPGRTEWEGFSTATLSAAAGGVTTLVEMPLNSIPPTVTAEALRIKIAAAAGKLHVDAGFWGGVVPANTEQLKPLWEAGVFGFKCFLVASGVEEFPPVTEADLRTAMPSLAEMGAPLLVHAELPGPIDEAAKGLKKASPRNYSTWLLSRPPAAEEEAIELILRLGREFGVHIHVVHLSAASALSLLVRAKAETDSVSIETCPHYLSFAAEDIPDGATEFKCAPPIRERANRELLWQALDDGVIDFIATDHSPCLPGMKNRDSGDFIAAWGGIASLQLSLPAIWTSAHARGYPLPRLADWLCKNPARLAGLDGRKGAIAVGRDADLVVWNPDEKFRVDESMLYQRHKLTPYLGAELRGAVETTFLRGRKVYDRGQFQTGAAGQILKRGEL
jgi:allantoinase